MSQNFKKLTIVFVVTQILFTLLLQKHVTIAEPELPFNNQTLKQILASPLISKRNLTQVFEDAHVVGYVDEGLEPAVRWPFEFSSKIWNYVKNTYGKFGDDEHLYVLLNSSNETIVYKNYLNIQLLLSNVTYPTNVVECRSDSGWKKINEVDGILCLATQVSDLVMTFAKEKVDTDFLLDMRNGGNLEIKWQPIFVYYFLLKCDQKQLAASYIQTSLTAFYSSEQINGSYWMRDWFLPIYSQYGGADVINTFFENKAKYFPNTMSKMEYLQYERRMAVGEFVHFWSGAANVNLRDQFSKIVNWDVDLEAQLRKAQMDFPQMKYVCPSCGTNLGLNIHDEPQVNSEIIRLIPKVSVHFEEVHNLSQPNYNATFTRRAPVYLYEPKKKSLGPPPSIYRYNNINPLYIVETEQNACYLVTCKSTHLVKWVTNIPVKDVESEFELSCESWKYMNSRRLNDRYDFVNQRAFTTPAGENKANTSLFYTIQFIFRAHRSNMGVLTCQNIENSSSATHYYFTDYPVHEKTTKLINYANELKTTSISGKHITNQVIDAFHSAIELFWENSNITWFVVPCRGSRLSVEPNLTLTLHYLGLNRKWYKNATQLWESGKGSLVLKLEYDGDHSSALQYEPVEGFTLDPAFQYFIFRYVFAYSFVRIHFKCTADDGSKMLFNVYPFQKAQSQGLKDARITELVQETELLKPLSGCFYIKTSDQFVSKVDRRLNYNNSQQYAVKLIRCSCPYECDIVRQCLDFQHGICYSKRCEIQFARTRLVSPHNHGMLRCIDYNIKYGARAVYEYTFVGLDRRRYLLSNDVPTKAIIFLEETLPVLYTNVEVTFRCYIVHFMLVPNIKFALLYKNKKTLELYNKKDAMQKKYYTKLEAGIYNTRDVSSVMNTQENLGVSWREINLTLAADVVGIMCLAPFHNSTDWASVTRSFVTKDVNRPIINRTGRIRQKYFYEGDLDFKLDCNAHGAPPPKIKWTFSDYYTTVSAIYDPHPTPVNDDSGNSVLIFPRMEKSYAGTFTCVASNKYGDDSYEYHVKSKERHIDSEFGTGEIVGIGLIVIITLFPVLRCLVLWFQYQQVKKIFGDLTPEEVNEFKNGSGNQSCGSHIQGKGQININMLPFDEKFIINSEDLMIEKGVILGQGHFGIVHRGLLNGIPVAVKTLKSTADVTFVKALLSELKIMSFIGDHAHIIHFYGAVIEKIQTRVVEAVVELSRYGNLLHYLRKLGLSSSLATSKVYFCNLIVNDGIVRDTTKQSRKVITTLDLIDWCRQIASGMDFISSKNVYHGDLAARNILLFRNKTIKITDFGFAKQLYSSPLYVKKQKIALPWRWMSLESLRFLEFSIQSDVWAFGVTMWEIFSLGQTPYPGLTWSPEFIKGITKGKRMTKPDYCLKLMYDQMLNCWDKNPEKRPQFLELVQFFGHFLQPFGPFVDTNQGQTMQEMDTRTTASTSTGSTSRACSASAPKTVDGQSSDILYTVV